MFITAGFIWFVVFWLSKHVSNRADLEGKAQDAISSSSWGIFFVVFFSIIREGFESLDEPSETEEDMLDKAWGLEPQSRLSCQIYPGKKDLVVELPKYTVNQVSEEI